MKKYFTHLLALVACFMCTMNAHAQFSAEFEQEPVGYTVISKAFPLSEIATAMGVQTADLTSALQSWIATEGEAETDYFFLKTADGLSNNYTQGGKGGFWMTANPATPVDWTADVGDDVWYNIFSVDEENLTIGVGQHPDVFQGGEEMSAQFVLQFDGKEATFDVTFKIIKQEKPDIPTPETDLTKLNIVGEKTVEIPQYPNQATRQSIDLAGVAAALGTTDEVMEQALGELLFMATVELRGDEESKKPYKTNTLSNESTANTGFWMAAIWDDEVEGFTEEVTRSYWDNHVEDGVTVSYGSFRTMYSEQYTYDAATHTLSSVTGWATYSLDMGTKYNFDLYIVYGNKAYKIHHVITLSEKPHEDPSKWKKIGEENQELSFYQGGYTTTMNLDLDAIAAQLGGEVSNLRVYGPEDEEGNISDEHTANNGGMWFSGTGLVCTWNSSVEGSPFTFYIEPVNNGDFSTWNVGQNDGVTAVGETYTTTLFFFNGYKGDDNVNYYAVNVSIKCEKEPQGDFDFESVITWNLSAVTQPYDGSGPSYGYFVDEYPTIDLAELEAASGTSSPVFYSWVKTEDGTDYSKRYTCDPYPGFWMDNEGYNVNWGNNSYVGCSYLADGTFQLFQMPGVNQLGDVWKTQLFLVNAETGKMATINLTVIFGEAVQVEEVGETSITMGIGTSSNYYDVDFTEAVKGFGIEKIGDVLGSRCMRAVSDDGTWTEHMAPGDGVPLNELGALDISPGNILAMAWIYAEPKDDNTVTFELEPGNIKIEPGKKVTTKLAFEYEPEGEDAIAKRFVVNITLTDEASLDGVNGIKADITSIEVYDLAGRRVTTAAPKGIYIVGGRKVVR